MFAKKLLVLSIVLTVSVAQQSSAPQENINDLSPPSTFVDLLLCPFQNEPVKCAGQYAGRMFNEFSQQVTNARKNTLAEVDRDVEKNLQARGFSETEIRGQKPSALVKVIENSVEGITALVGDAIVEVLAPEKSLGKQDDDSGDFTQIDDGSDNESDDGDNLDYGRDIGEFRGKKKKKKKKALMKLLILGAVIKAKIELLLKLIATKLQIKFLLIAALGLLINVARFWIDLKKKHEPQKVIYYENAQHQHHYEDHDDKWGGYWKRSLNVGDKAASKSDGGNFDDYQDTNEGVIDTRTDSNYRNLDNQYYSHNLAYQNHRPY